MEHVKHVPRNILWHIKELSICSKWYFGLARKRRIIKNSVEAMY